MPRANPSKKARGASSSNRKRRDPSPSFDEEKFTSYANEQWFNSKTKNSMVVEKSIHPNIEELFNLRTAFNNVGWGRLLEFGGEYYPNLVKQFYANMEEKEEKETTFIHTWVKGVEIRITKKMIVEFLGVPNEGPEFSLFRDFVVGDPNWNMAETLQKFGIPNESSRNRKIILSKYLGIRERLLVQLLGHNIMPRASGLNEVRIFDLFVIDKMIHGFDARVPGIPVAPIIFDQIRGVVRLKGGKAFIFPILLSRWMVRLGVNVSNEEVAYTTTTENISESTLYNMGYRNVQGIWRNLVREPQFQEHEAVNELDVVGTIDEVPIREPEQSTEADAPAARRAPRPRRSLLRRILTICRNLDDRIRVMEGKIDQIKAYVDSQLSASSSSHQ